MDETIKQAPPRELSTPQTPAPQTCFGVLNDKGIPIDGPMINDCGPDFGWMSGVEVFITAIRLHKRDTDKGFVIIPGKYHDSPTEQYRAFKTWQHVPFTMSKWWTGTYKLRVIAVMPPRVTGKIIVTWTGDAQPEFDKYGSIKNNPDTLYRRVKKEWDLGETKEFDILIPAFNVLESRPTWIPRLSWRDMSAKSATGRYFSNQFASWALPTVSWHMGAVWFRLAQDLQPGSIFPDSYRFLFFGSFVNAEFSVPTDPRAHRSHLFSISEKTFDIGVPENRRAPQNHCPVVPP